MRNLGYRGQERASDSNNFWRSGNKNSPYFDLLKAQSAQEMKLLHVMGFETRGRPMQMREFAFT